MKRFISLLALSTLAGIGAVLSSPPACGEDRPAAPVPAAPATRTFSFTYKVTIPKPAAGSKHLDAWVPTPVEDQFQKVADLKVTATADGKDVAFEQTTEPQYGNKMVHVGVDNPAADLVVSWTATITRTIDEGQGTSPMNPRFTEADNLVPLDGKAATLAKELGADAKDVDPAERAKKIYDNVLSTMVYDKVAPGYGKGDFNRACEIGKGNCTDFHAKFTGIARASGIPVRFTMGVVVPTDPKAEPSGYHCWAHWHDGKAWKPVDISEAQKIVAKDSAKAQWFFGHLDADRFALSVGRDLTLAPKQAGKPLLFFPFAYVEVDGVEAVDPKAKENRVYSFANK